MNAINDVHARLGKMFRCMYQPADDELKTGYTGRKMAKPVSQE
jgi:hypothetical protein